MSRRDKVKLALSDLCGAPGAENNPILLCEQCGAVFTTNKVNTSLYIFPNSAQTASTSASNCLQFQRVIVCPHWLAEREQGQRKIKEGRWGVHSCMSSRARWMDGWMWKRIQRVPHNSTPQQCKSCGCCWGEREVTELSHLMLCYRPISKTQLPPLSLHLSWPSLRTSGFILEGQGQPSRKC